MPPACPPRSNRQSQPETARTSRGEEREKAKEDRAKRWGLAPACLPNCRPSHKGIEPRPKPARQEPAPQASRHPARHRAQLQPRLIFCPLSILLLESLQNPGPFSPVSRRTTAPRPPAWTPPAPGEPSHFRARPVSHETTQYLYSITYTPYPHFSLGNNLDDSPTVNELNPYLQNHIFSLTTSVFLSTLYNSPRLQSYSSPIATKKTNNLIDFRPQIW